MLTFPITVGEREVAVEIADAVYPVAAVHGAAVIHIEKSYIRIDRASPGRTRISLRPKLGGATPEELRELGGHLLNELLHQALRLEVGQKTDKLRELVIGKAIMSAESAQPGGLDGGVAFSDDPLGIARPWEETYLGEQPGNRGGDK